jgi:flavorubredoxin
MGSITLFDNKTHRNVLLEDRAHGHMVQANQHLIIHGAGAMILDPGGHKVYNRVLADSMHEMGSAKLTHIFLSHQDPDIVAAINGWLMTTDATAYASQLWLRFIPHFGLDTLVSERLIGIPDEGTVLDVGGAPLVIVPAHFLHSEGNFQVYDPQAKVLYTGDLGASLGMPYREITSAANFDAHVEYMAGFHRRYMTAGKVLKAWAAMVRPLDIETIAPQHGAMMRGRDTVARFIDWCDQLECGIDLILDKFKVPTR